MCIHGAGFAGELFAAKKGWGSRVSSLLSGNMYVITIRIAVIIWDLRFMRTLFVENAVLLKNLDYLRVEFYALIRSHFLG